MVTRYYHLERREGKGEAYIEATGERQQLEVAEGLLRGLSALISMTPVDKRRFDASSGSLKIKAKISL